MLLTITTTVDSFSFSDVPWSISSYYLPTETIQNIHKSISLNSKENLTNETEALLDSPVLTIQTTDTIININLLHIVYTLLSV